MGNVGWNEEESVCEQRAGATLEEAGVEAASVRHLHARGLLGSSVEMEFISNAAGWSVAEKVRKISKS